MVQLWWVSLGPCIVSVPPTMTTPSIRPVVVLWWLVTMARWCQLALPFCILGCLGQTILDSLCFALPYRQSSSPFVPILIGHIYMLITVTSLLPSSVFVFCVRVCVCVFSLPGCWPVSQFTWYYLPLHTRSGNPGSHLRICLWDNVPSLPQPWRSMVLLQQPSTFSMRLHT